MINSAMHLKHFFALLHSFTTKIWDDQVTSKLDWTRYKTQFKGNLIFKGISALGLEILILLVLSHSYVISMFREPNKGNVLLTTISLPNIIALFLSNSELVKSIVTSTNHSDYFNTSFDD